MNLFVAIFPDRNETKDISTILTAHIHRFPEDRFRYIRPEKRHVTILFLGDFDQERCLRASERFSRWADTSQRTLQLRPLVFDRIGTFPPGRRSGPLALTTSAQPDPSIVGVREELSLLLDEFSPDRRFFRPHLTVAYQRRKTPGLVVPKVSIAPITLCVSHLTLVATRPRQGASIYEILAAVPFGDTRCT